MEKKLIRYTHLDELKGLAILLMVMGHCLAWSYKDYSFLLLPLNELNSPMFNSSIIWRIIYSFHMPLLFLISGYLFYKSNKISLDDLKVQFIKRIKRLLIPYLTTGFFMLAISGYFGYWFLLVLFVINTIVLFIGFLAQKLNNKGEFIIYLVVALILSYISKYVLTNNLPHEFTSFKNLHIYYLAFIYGFLMRKYKQIEGFIMNQFISFLCFVLFIVFFIIKNYFGMLSGILEIIIPLLISSFLFSCFRLKPQTYNMEKYNISGLNIIGIYSMEIYIFHIFFVMAFKEVGNYIMTIDSLGGSISIQIIYSLIVSMLAIYLSIITANFIKGNKYLSKFILGI